MTPGGLSPEFFALELLYSLIRKYIVPKLSYCSVGLPVFLTLLLIGISCASAYWVLPCTDSANSSGFAGGLAHR